MRSANLSIAKLKFLCIAHEIPTYVAFSQNTMLSGLWYSLLSELEVCLAETDTAYSPCVFN